MKTIFTLVCLALFTYTSYAQDEANYSFYDYSEDQLSNTASIPDFESKETKIKITGTIYESDGVTPAKDVILYIEQPDENGRYDVKKENDKQYVYHRGWVKTDENGEYTFYTFMPGSVRRSGEFKHIHPVVKAPGQTEYDLNAFLFDNDPLLTKMCRKRLKRKGMENSILKFEEKDSVLVAKRDIVLGENAALSK